jgi:hypothetical protein
VPLGCRFHSLCAVLPKPSCRWLVDLPLDLTDPKALTRRLPRCLTIAGIFDGTRPASAVRVARAFVSALWARATRTVTGGPSQPRASDPPGASGQRIPRFARDATTSVAGRSVPEASGSPGPKREKRWCRGHIHFSPERARAVRRAPARPEWSVASDARRDRRERLASERRPGGRTA